MLTTLDVIILVIFLTVFPVIVIWFANKTTDIEDDLQTNFDEVVGLSERIRELENKDK